MLKFNESVRLWVSKYDGDPKCHMMSFCDHWTLNVHQTLESYIYDKKESEIYLYFYNKCVYIDCQTIYTETFFWKIFPLFIHKSAKAHQRLTYSQEQFIRSAP